MNDSAMIRSFMGGLIDRVGGYDAAAAHLSARLGHDVSKGTISKRQSGQLEWPLVEIMALEDAAGDRCVRRWLRRNDPEGTESEELLSLIASASKEGGEAMTALINLVSGRGDLTDARKELEESIAVKERIRAHLNQRSVA